MLVSRNVFHVVSALQSILSLHIFILADQISTLAAFIVCSPLQFVTPGYFYWLAVKNSNHLHTELSLGYLIDTKFYLESKASFIDISSPG